MTMEYSDTTFYLVMGAVILVVAVSIIARATNWSGETTSRADRRTGNYD